MASLGIDVGGSSVKLAWVDAGLVVWTDRTAGYARPDRACLAASIRDVLAARGPTGAAGVTGVGLCVPGLLDRRARSVTLSVNVPGLIGVPLDDLVADALGRPVPVVILNDAAAAALDVYARERFAGRLLAVSLGTGVGAAVLDDGVPLLVEGESPGHLGQVDVSLPDDPATGPDGGAGSLEAYIGTPALIARYGPGTTATLAGLTAAAPPVRALARALRIAHAIYRPHHIVLLGGVGIRLAHLIPTLQTLVNTRLTTLARPGWTLQAGTDDHHAARGAARAAAQIDETSVRDR